MTTMQGNLARQNKGQPNGGQFKTATRAESMATLDQHLSDEEYNASGTFLHPPRARSLKQHVDFWMRVEVPDPVLDNITYGYEEWRITWRDANVTLRIRQWEDDNNLPFDGHKSYSLKPKLKAQLDQLIADEDARLDAIHPRRIPSTRTRTVARVGQMVWVRGGLSPEEEKQLLAMTVTLGDNEFTAAEVFEMYAIGNIQDSFSDPTREVLRSINNMRREQIDLHLGG